MRKCLAAFAALAVAACSPAPADVAATSSTAAKAVHPVSGLPVVPLTVESEGRSHRFMVEVARTSAEQARGLMFREAMGVDEGMIFPMKPPRSASFWMHNTVISLDLIFIGPDGRVRNIAANAVPYDETPLVSRGAVSAVLELNGGRAAQLGIGEGDVVRW
ncbi:MAG: DUF192 domain-containing protein [Novosphingobium sp.]|nr:DUF192 domain-containing protein [Novosphingobium sp.]